MVHTHTLMRKEERERKKKTIRIVKWWVNNSVLAQRETEEAPHVISDNRGSTHSNRAQAGDKDTKNRKERKKA